MKHLKKTRQKNVTLDKGWYTEYELKMYKDSGFIDDIFEDGRYFIYLEKGDELQIEVDDYGYYVTTLTNKNGKWYIIINF